MEVIARFESERQALALMNHPNIASVFDAGATGEGRPYFAMEYVPGEPITAYCDKHRLTLRQRLDLFLHICEGVQHAHQKGIIHRDIKPSNILVTVQDDEPVPKIIDFGVAKATVQRLTEKTVYTELGQLIGTPEYMSPEQAEMTGADIDTRTDVYALGVILYELLVGAQPFDATELRRAGFDGMRRIIREKAPSKPSTRLSSLGDTSTDKARSRGTELAVLERQLRGDLDWITMKALEKDRTRRYGSPSELAEDIRRHLRHEPVVAGPPGQVYRMRKFTQRHRIAVAVATGFLALLVGFAILMAIQSARIARERDRAEQEAAKSEAVTDFLRDTLSSADPYGGLGREVTVLDALGEAVRKIEESLESEREIKAALQDTIGYTYTELGRYEEAEPLLRSSLAMRRAVLGDEHLDVAESLFHLGLVQLERDDPQKNDHELAAKHFGEALAIYRKLLGEDSLEAADVLNALGVLRAYAGDEEEAEAHYRESLAIRRKLLTEDAVEIGQSLGNLALSVLGRGIRT
jgi:tetratricopeptide (TPR) repeat protein